MTNSYRRAYTEVLEILSHFSESEYSRIPSQKIDFYEKNKDKEYFFQINPEMDLSQQNISREANAILISLYRDFFATEEQIKSLNNLLNQNQTKLENAKKEKYNSTHVFENPKPQIESEKKVEEQIEIVEYRENFFSKFTNFIKNMFKKK